MKLLDFYIYIYIVYLYIYIYSYDQPVVVDHEPVLNCSAINVKATIWFGQNIGQKNDVFVNQLAGIDLWWSMYDIVWLYDIIWIYYLVRQKYRSCYEGIRPQVSIR